jgi:hypothetical protein
MKFVYPQRSAGGSIALEMRVGSPKRRSRKRRRNWRRRRHLWSGLDSAFATLAPSSACHVSAFINWAHGV